MIPIKKLLVAQLTYAGLYEYKATIKTKTDPQSMLSKAPTAQTLQMMMSVTEYVILNLYTHSFLTLSIYTQSTKNC